MGGKSREEIRKEGYKISNSITCNGKLSFPSYEAANSKYRQVSTGGYIKRTSKQRDNLRPYRCENCHYWHLGHEDSADRFDRKKPYKREKSRRAW